MSHHLLVRLYEIICIKHNFISLHICLVKVYCTIVWYHHMNCICIYIKVVQIKTVDIWNNVWVSEQTQLCVVCRTLSAWQRYIVCSTLCTLLIAYGQSHGHGHGFGHNHGLSAVETKEEGRKDTSLSCTFLLIQDSTSVCCSAWVTVTLIYVLVGMTLQKFKITTHFL